jgi:hypothetical protein
MDNNGNTLNAIEADILTSDELPAMFRIQSFTIRRKALRNTVTA